MRTEKVRREIALVRTSSRAQHDRVRNCLLMICDEIDRLAGDQPEPETPQPKNEDRPDIKGATSRLMELQKKIQKKGGKGE